MDLALDATCMDATVLPHHRPELATLDISRTMEAFLALRAPWESIIKRKLVTKRVRSAILMDVWEPQSAPRAHATSAISRLMVALLAFPALSESVINLR
jgi:hypothetical protein